MLTYDANRAGFDWRAFSKAVKVGLAETGHSYRQLADGIGVTISDLSRAAGGSNIGPEKVIAISDWLGRDIRDFYLAPEKKANENNLFHRDTRETSPLSAEARQWAEDLRGLK